MKVGDLVRIRWEKELGYTDQDDRPEDLMGLIVRDNLNNPYSAPEVDFSYCLVYVFKHRKVQQWSKNCLDLIT